MSKTLEEIGTPYAVQYFGGRLTGDLTDRLDYERDPMHHTYVGDMTKDEFYEEVERQMILEFGE